MNKSTEIWNELNGISPALAAMERVNVFQVPDDYCNELDKRICTSVFLHQDEKNMDLKVPDGYFEGLSNRILLKIKNTFSDSTVTEINNVKREIESISPLLFSLNEKNVFTVPDNYFENFNDVISSKLNNSKAKIFSINKERKWWKYAAAAVITGGVLIGALQIFNNQSRQDNNQLMTASANIPGYIKLSLKYNTPEQLDKGIASLSANDIAEYLEKHGSVMDDGILTKDVDTTGLPSADDYLLDDNTLNNFLNAIEINGSIKNTQ
jgi:hypothetical protein